MAPSISLQGASLAKWTELEPIISARPALKPTTIAALEAYCAAYGRWHTAEQFLADPAHGPVVTIRDDKGNIRSHGPAPQLAIAERAQKEMTRLARMLRI